MPKKILLTPDDDLATGLLKATQAGQPIEATARQESHASQAALQKLRGSVLHYEGLTAPLLGN